MSEDRFDALTRRAADVVTRRSSLLALGGAGLAASLAMPELATAGKAGKKAKKKCRSQGTPCREFADQICELFLDPGSSQDQCKEAAKDCCPAIEGCKGAEFFDCALSVIISITAV
jgi:hypothetical protein